jgi:NTE family protein
MNREAIGGLAGELLSDLPPGEADRVQSRVSVTACKAGEILLREGQWHGQMYVVRSGVLSVNVTTASGEVRHLAKLLPGDSAGEMSILTGTPASATVTALVDSELWSLQHVDFVELLATCPTLARNVAVVLSQRLSATNRLRRLGVSHLLRLRVHRSVPSALAEEVARSIAKHLCKPLLALEQRQTSSWRAGERLPCLDELLADSAALQRLDPDQPAQPLAGETGPISAESWALLEASLPEYATHALVISEVDEGAWLPSNAGQAAASLALWPERAGRLPIPPEDVAIVTDGEPINTAAALEHLSQRHGGRVVRVISPGGQDAHKHVGWLARHLAGLKVGLALGGGDPRGFAHLGVLQGLRRAGVPIDYISGCSIGAVVASEVALGFDALPQAKVLLPWSRLGAAS